MVLDMHTPSPHSEALGAVLGGAGERKSIQTVVAVPIVVAVGAVLEIRVVGTFTRFAVVAISATGCRKDTLCRA